MVKCIEVIKPGHKLYSESIDSALNDRTHQRFKVKLNKGSLDSFLRLGQDLRKLKHEELPHGVLIMLGFAPRRKDVDEYFIYGVNTDTSRKVNLVSDYDKTLDFVLKRAQSEEDHDCAFLISSDGWLRHSGSEFIPPKKLVYKAHGFSTYYEFKEKAKIKAGGTRMGSAALQSMVFVNALFIAISESGDPSKKYFVQNGRLRQIKNFSAQSYYNNALR